VELADLGRLYHRDRRLFSYPFFARYPITRDFPWANLPLFAAAGILLVMGLVRAFGNPKAYRGKISGPILTTLSLLIFQQRLPDFEARRISVVGISVDTPEFNRRQSQKLGCTYPLLSDARAEVIRRYDLLHVGAGPRGADIARPAEFLIDTSGTIRCVNLTENIAVRARPKQVLKGFDEFKGNRVP
jgi:peroxiredoxin